MDLSLRACSQELNKMYKHITKKDYNDRKFGCLWVKQLKNDDGSTYTSVTGNIEWNKFGDYQGKVNFQAFSNENQRNQDDPKHYFYVSPNHLELLKIPEDPISDVDWNQYNIPEFE